MFRNSAAPLAVSVFLLASCGGGGDSVAPPPEPPGGETPPAAEDINLAMSPPPKSEAPKDRSNPNSQTLARIYENMPWSRTVAATDGDGEPVALSLTDNGNGDAEMFTFDTETGEFSLRAPQDYERAQDANGDNEFDLMMVAHEFPGAPSIPFKMEIVDRKEIFEDFPVVWLRGETVFGGLGRNITSLGDIDDDGRPDLAVAAPGRHSRDDYADLPPAGYHPAGEAYVLSGEVLGGTTLLNLDEADTAGVWHLVGTEDDKNVGYNMTLVGDLDDDELDDFVIARDETTLEIISGATLLNRMKSGGDSVFDDLPTGTISLPTNQLIGPRTLAAIGDLNDDGLTDLAMCTYQAKGGGSVEAQVYAVSGAALKDVMFAGTTRPISDLYAKQQAAYYAYTGNHYNCGPLSALGDVNNDGLIDVAIPVPGPLAGDAGVMVFGGAELLEMMQVGGRHKLSSFDIFVGKKPPFTRFFDNDAIGTEQDYMVTALEDVTGDGVDDFGFSWVRYQRADDSAFIIKGGASLLSADGAVKNIRAMVPGGDAIQLAASPDGLTEDESRVEPLHALLAPKDGLHPTLVFVGAGETTGHLFDSYSVTADELPDGGTSIVPLPIAGTGLISIPRANGRLLSHVTSVGDLNTDGYGDLAVGWGTSGGGRTEDTGDVLLVSGKEIVEARNRGEALVPSDMLAPQQ